MEDVANLIFKKYFGEFVQFRIYFAILYRIIITMV